MNTSQLDAESILHAKSLFKTLVKAAVKMLYAKLYTQNVYFKQRPGITKA